MNSMQYVTIFVFISSFVFAKASEEIDKLTDTTCMALSGIIRPLLEAVDQCLEKYAHGEAKECTKIKVPADKKNKCREVENLYEKCLGRNGKELPDNKKFLKCYNENAKKYFQQLKEESKKSGINFEMPKVLQ